MRPTGKLHLGNYMGALKNWVELQNATNADGSPKYECYFFIADFHALTTDYADTSELPANVKDVLLDFLAAGLDTKRSTIFLQSEVPAHAELSLLLGMITPLGWLERVPTYKDQQEQLKEKDLATYGFLGYPVIMSADILVYQTDFVPVGMDQEAHVEITREIARRFNGLYKRAYASDEHLLSEASKAVRQFPDVSDFVQKYLHVLPEPNTILPSDPEPEVRAKLKTMVTDPARIRRTDAGNPEICPVFDLHKVFSSGETQGEVRAGCTSAGIGCIQCKGWLADAVVKELAPIQERRRYFEAHPDEANAILDEGAARANARAEQTMREVRAAVRLARR
jgi:tryptophanyl-tRNA synthetase